MLLWSYIYRKTKLRVPQIAMPMHFLAFPHIMCLIGFSYKLCNISNDDISVVDFYVNRSITGTPSPFQQAVTVSPLQPDLQRDTVIKFMIIKCINYTSYI